MSVSFNEKGEQRAIQQVDRATKRYENVSFTALSDPAAATPTTTKFENNQREGTPRRPHVSFWFARRLGRGFLGFSRDSALIEFTSPDAASLIDVEISSRVEQISLPTNNLREIIHPWNDESTLQFLQLWQLHGSK